MKNSQFEMIVRQIRKSSVSSHRQRIEIFENLERESTSVQNLSMERKQLRKVFVVRQCSGGNAQEIVACHERIPSTGDNPRYRRDREHLCIGETRQRTRKNIPW